MKAQVEKDEGPEAETLSRLLIVLKAHNKYVLFFYL